MVEMFKQLKNVAFIICISFITYQAMRMTNNVKWIWFMLFGLFAL